MNQTINVTVNGEAMALVVDIRQSLLEVLREQLHLTGAKAGCEAGECGACTVIVDGESIVSCLYLAVWAHGKKIETIEGQSIDGHPSVIQQAYVEENAIQCGFCTPGFVMSTTALLRETPHPTPEEIRKGLSGNMCRCTGYQNIIRAVQRAAGAISGPESSSGNNQSTHPGP